MPIFMDVHVVPGVDAVAVANAHQRDILIQDEHQCKCLTYWIDEERESIFCLIEAPEKEAVVQLHNRAHGLIPNKVIEVNTALVQSFLGRIYDPLDAEISSDGLKVFCDPSFRTLLVTKSIDPVLLQHQTGAGKADELLEKHNDIISKNIARHDGTQAEHGGPGFIASFTSPSKAVACAVAIQNDLQSANINLPAFSIGISSGLPVSSSNTLFGDTIRFAGYLSTIAKNGQVGIASSVRELVIKEHFHHLKNNFFTLAPHDEHLLDCLFSKLEENFQDSDFDIPDYCQVMAMSQSQLYRKTIAITGLSPNLLLKDFRLAKALELMKRKRANISEITFDSGFTSPSYFTKCFKKKYGLLPITYLDLLH